MDASRPGGRAWPALLVAAAAIACFGATLGHGLVQDDVEIRTSPLLARPFDALAVWRGGFLAPEFHFESLYRPLAQWTLLLNARANELLLGDALSGAGFHAGNLLLHAGASVALLLWLGAIGLPRAAALGAALLFAVHPVHTEAVANVSARSEPLALILGLAFLIAHRKGRPIPAALLLLASLWSKESAVGFAGVAVASDLLLAPRGARPRAWALYALVVAVWLAMRRATLADTSPEIVFLDNPAASAGTLERVLTALAVQLDYLRLLAWPARQSIDYGYAVNEVVGSALDPRVLGFLAIAAGAVAGALLLRRRAPEVALGVAGYALLFLVTANVLFPIGSIEAERLAYMPSAFASLLAAAALARMPARAAAAAVALVGALLGAKSWSESLAWKDEATLYRAAVLKAPASAKSHLQLAGVLEREGDLEGAAREYGISTSIHAGYGPAWFLYGNLLHRLGRTPEAVLAWRSALGADPSLADVRANLCGALLELGRRGEAVAEARALFAADPAHARLPELHDRLADSAPAEDVAAARAALAEARAALAARDPQRAIEAAQRAILAGALARGDRREALRVLADAWGSNGREGAARIFAAALDQLIP